MRAHRRTITLRRLGDRLEETGQEWAEVCFVPAGSARKKDGHEYRFLATCLAAWSSMPGA